MNNKTNHGPCNGRGWHLSKREHPKGAGRVVSCSGCTYEPARLLAARQALSFLEAKNPVKISAMKAGDHNALIQAIQAKLRGGDA